jgi:hypothetical protein
MRSLRPLLLVLLSLAALAGAAPAAPAAPLSNLAHLDFLGDQVTPPAQAGHTTYQLDTEPAIGVLWTYAEPDGSGGWKRLGGGTYDPATNTYGQGAFNADDISRAAVVYVRHYEQFGDQDSRQRAFELLRGLAYLQTVDGPHAGEVVLWMQPDGSLNPTPTPADSPNPSDSGPSYWLARSIWAYGEGYALFRTLDPDFAAFLQQRMELSLQALERDVLTPSYGTYRIVDGLRWPAWLIVDGADASSEAMYGLSAYVAATADTAAAADLRALGQGVAAMQLGSARRWPFGALMPWALSRSDWHAWGDQMSGSLATAGSVLHEDGFVSAAVREAGSFTPHLLVQGGPDNGWLPVPADRSQIAYGAEATLENLVRTAAAAHRPAFDDLAGVAAAWYFGNNASGQPVYDPATGVTFDGVAPDGSINHNSGAESTIMGQLSMLALDAHPAIEARANAAARQAQVTWQVAEAESGTLAGAASVVTPSSAWTGESQWSGGASVDLGRGGSTTTAFTPPVSATYLLFPVFLRQIGDGGRISVGFTGEQHRHLDTGGAGEQGASAIPGFLDVGLVRARGAAAGPASVTVRGQSATPTSYDATLVQPEVEWLLLGGDAAGGQGVLRSFATARTTRSVTLPGAGPISARAYTRTGRLVASLSDPSGTIEAPVAARGFTVVTRGPA